MSVLRITAEDLYGRTAIAGCGFTSPLKIARPFLRGGMTEVMMMAASAGLLDGDRYDIDIEVRQNASLRFTAQSFTKVFKAQGKGAEQSVNIRVEDGGTLFFLPPPVIPFGGSRFQGITRAELGKNSRFAICEIIACGRTGMGESFAWESFCSRICVSAGGRPVFIDAQRLVPEERDPSGTGFFEGFSHIGTMYVYGAEDAELPAHPSAAKTRALEGICIRAAGGSAEEVQDVLKKTVVTGKDGPWNIFP